MSGCQRISYAGCLSDTFRRLRPELIRWTAKLGAPYGSSLEWWMSSLAGKNVLATPIFLHICYLDVLSQITREWPGGALLIVCEDEYLLAAMKRLLRAAGHSTTRTAGWPVHLALYTFSEVARIAYRWIKAIGMLVAQFAAARLTRHRRRRAGPRDAGKEALIHTCIDDTCFGPNGEFRDRYFCGLADWLRGRGYHVTMLPWVYNTRRNVFENFRWFRSSRDSFLLVEDYLRATDLFRCGWKLARCGRILKGKQRFGLHDVSPLVHRERRISASPSLLLRFLLYGPALERWIAEGHECTVFIDMFENSAPERPQIASLRKCSPATLLIGYQHGAASLSEFLPYAIDPDEWRHGIFPDRIVCSGEFTANILVRGGFPQDHVVAGPALRYRHLVDRSRASLSSSAACAAPRRQALVMLSLELSGALELLHRLLAIRELLAQCSLEVVLRAHPMTDRGILLRACGLNGLPAAWTWGDAPLAEQLARAAVVISTGTNAQVDAAASGIPVVCVKRELGFDYNFLDYWSDTYPVCRPIAPQDLAPRLSQILEDREGNMRAQVERLAAEIVEGLGKLDDAHFSAFI